MDRDAPSGRRTSSGREPRQARSRATRTKLLHAAAELIEKQGFERTSMGQVAELAGVGMGTLYRHFPDKRTLLLDLVDHWSDRLSEARRGDLRLQDFIQKDPRAALTAILRRLYERLHDRKWFYLEILPRAQRDEELARRLQQLKREGAERFATIIEFGQQSGLLRKQPNPAIAAALVINTLELLTAHVLSGSESETEPVLAELTDMLCRYLVEDPSS